MAMPRRQFCKNGHDTTILGRANHNGTGSCRACYPIYYRRKSQATKKNEILKCRYGITLENFNSLIIKQNSKCAICSKLKKLLVDHDHETGKVRGLLCYTCNTSLRGIENKDFYEKAKIYLKENT